MLEAQRYVEQGHKVVVDVDLAKFFDRVNHDILMDWLAKRIADASWSAAVEAVEFGWRDLPRRDGAEVIAAQVARLDCAPSSLRARRGAAVGLAHEDVERVPDRVYQLTERASSCPPTRPEGSARGARCASSSRRASKQPQGLQVELRL